MSRLPLELYEVIIQLLREDRDTLKALSISFRDLTAPSQRHLFAHVIIQPPWQCLREYHNVSGAASAFRQVLDTSPHIGEYVKSLEVSDRTFHARNVICNQHPPKDGSWIHDDKDLPSCLARLTTLRALVMDYISLDKPVSQALHEAIYKIIHLPSLVYLELGDDPTMSVVQRSGTNLQHLVIHPNGGDISLTHKSEAPDDIVALHSLFLKQCESLRVETLLESGSRVSLQGLKRIAAKVVDFGHYYEALAKILQVCRTSLEELFLDWHYISKPDLETSFHLNNLPALKRFHVYFISSNDPSDGAVVQLPWFISLLEQSLVEAHPLEELSVEQYLRCNVEDRREEFMTDLYDGWRKITDILLNRQQLPRFQCFKLRIFSDTPGLPTAAVELLESSDFFQQMKPRLASFTIFGRAYRHCIMADFVPDHTWLSMVDRYELKMSHIPAT